ncbi:hypothetical protein AVEN_1828-1 [Araneus ventricosus]|uniref:Uncharacterized protein n=1 Tax=Araneus ventricosus TaxID=182803 RepID=A0A4Y2TX07_ARAVE|nr:hypothetical protein AVEN_1828-1 [Araneus ventricosus]
MHRRCFLHISKPQPCPEPQFVSAAIKRHVNSLAAAHRSHALPVAWLTHRSRPLPVAADYVVPGAHLPAHRSMRCRCHRPERSSRYPAAAADEFQPLPVARGLIVPMRAHLPGRRSMRCPNLPGIAFHALPFMQDGVPVRCRSCCIGSRVQCRKKVCGFFVSTLWDVSEVDVINVAPPQASTSSLTSHIVRPDPVLFFTTFQAADLRRKAPVQSRGYTLCVDLVMRHIRSLRCQFSSTAHRSGTCPICPQVHRSVRYPIATGTSFPCIAHLAQLAFRPFAHLYSAAISPCIAHLARHSVPGRLARCCGAIIPMHCRARETGVPSRAR